MKITFYFFQNYFSPIRCTFNFRGLEKWLILFIMIGRNAERQIIFLKSTILFCCLLFAFKKVQTKKNKWDIVITILCCDPMRDYNNNKTKNGFLCCIPHLFFMSTFSSPNFFALTINTKTSVLYYVLCFLFTQIICMVSE